MKGMRVTPADTLDSGWKLVHDPDNIGREKEWYLGIPEDRAVEAAVPCFVHQYLPDCPGIAWYQCDFSTAITPDSDHAVFINFEMADFLCEVWLNGKRLGTHRGTENPFSFDASKYLLPSEKNRLSVRVSKPYTEAVDGYTFLEIPHRNQLASGLMPGTCYNTYGIGGAVTLSRLPKLRITDLYVNGNVETSSIDLECSIINEYSQPVTCEFSLLAAKSRTDVVCSDEITSVLLQPGETVLRRSLPISEMRLWDVDNPCLYVVEAEIQTGLSGHRVSKRCGFRTLVVGQGGYFYLNGRRILLRSAHTGNCMPGSTWLLSEDHSLLRKDFSMAKAAGLNMVRFISGAALPEQLDLCDELGLMVYEEPVSSWLLGDGSRSKELYMYDLLTMIRRDRSHACITIWGLLNETVSQAPYGDCCFIARDAISEVRALDETRLVLYNSGRFDRDPCVGSVCNPYSNQWECLWDGEDEKETRQVAYTPGDPGPTCRKMGDKHFYPKLPHSLKDIEFLRSIGNDTKKPFFLTEYGVGSLFDVIWLSRKFEQEGLNPRYPDVKMVYHMANQFLADIKRYGFDREFAFPIDIMRESHRLHNRHREIGFNIFRSNPWCCGISLTGLLDHSICGEGLWTLMREWKRGIADTLQDGFAPLRWCLFTSDTHLYARAPFTIEGVLANEDVLKAREYPIGLKITGIDGIVWEDAFILTIRPEDLAGLAVPVFKKELQLDLAEGEYTLCAEILEGAAANGHLNFIVSDDKHNCAQFPRVVDVFMGKKARQLLKRKGVEIIDAQDVMEPMIALVGNIPEAEKEGAWETIKQLLRKGCSVFIASRFAFSSGEDMNAWLPLENKPRSIPVQHGPTDWLYHKEYLAKREHPYFANLPTGMMNWDYYRQIICGAYFVHEDGLPTQDVASICFGIGEYCDDGYQGGMNLCSYTVENGRLILNAYLLLENLNTNPAADRLFLNILNAEYRALDRNCG
ncbi:MAG: hypothetical protein GXY52_10780 [Chloroflexi bacterium]|nr:hypothetical protein [Chloroflexota bacterium]